MIKAYGRGSEKLAVKSGFGFSTLTKQDQGSECDQGQVHSTIKDQDSVQTRVRVQDQH